MSNHPNRSRLKTAASNPTADQVRAAREAAGHTQKEAAELVYSSYRSWQYFEATNPEFSRKMHPAIFELYLFKTNQKKLII